MREEKLFRNMLSELKRSLQATLPADQVANLIVYQEESWIIQGDSVPGKEMEIEFWESDGDFHVICSIRNVSERKRLHDFSYGAMRASEEERQRIARELHDDTAQRLAALMLRVRLVSRQEDAEARQALLDDFRAELLAAAEGVKRIARGLRPPELEEIGLEAAFPKPFCSLEQDPSRPVINEFIRKFRIGKPKLQIFVHNDEIVNTQVDCCAPCGCTYYVAKNLIGKPLTPSINEDFTAKYWHSYPCVASMQMDAELGDTILHRGGYIHYSAVSAAVEEARKREED